ncbi:MAG: nitrate ABC transporter permease [Acidimicrobiaceae bacterium]|nr:nitrate ABC transporter permease [Acidimicrobiaceae bacterium]
MSAFPQTVARVPGQAERNWKSHQQRTARIRRLLGLSLPVLLLGLWQLSAALEWIDTTFYGSPVAAIGELWSLLTSGLLLDHLVVTLRRLLIGFVGGATAGVVVGLLLSQFKWLHAAFEPLLRAMYVVPKLALLPVLLLVFGLGDTPKVLFIGLGVFYLVGFMTLGAGALVPKEFHEAATAYGLSRAQRFRWLVLPATLPQIVSALRIASGNAVLLVVAVEFVSSSSGIGYLTWQSWQLFRPDRMYAGILTIAAIGVTFSLLVGALGRRLTPWAEDSQHT